MKKKEIERKFLIDGFPDHLDLIDECTIFQGYISINPEIRIRESRKKDMTESYKITFKSSGDLKRNEFEFNISERIYKFFCKFMKQGFIYKHFKKYKLENGLELECSLVDRFSDNGFYYAEIEFKNEEEANEFVPLPFFLKEITYDKNYKMKNYWYRTRK